MIGFFVSYAVGRPCSGLETCHGALLLLLLLLLLMIVVGQHDCSVHCYLKVRMVKESLLTRTSCHLRIEPSTTVAGRTMRSTSLLVT